MMHTADIFSVLYGVDLLKYLSQADWHSLCLVSRTICEFSSRNKKLVIENFIERKLIYHIRGNMEINNFTLCTYFNKLLQSNYLPAVCSYRRDKDDKKDLVKLIEQYVVDKNRMFDFPPPFIPIDIIHYDKGKIHRVGGPSVVFGRTGDIFYYKQGLYHRDNDSITNLPQPAIIWHDGLVEYYIEGRLQHKKQNRKYIDRQYIKNILRSNKTH